MGAARSREEFSSKNPAKKDSVDLTTFEARVDRVHIKGLGRTYDDYIEGAVSNLFKAKTLKEVLEQSDQARSNLSELGVFKELKVLIDISRGENASPKGYDVIFDATEMSRITGGVGTEIGQNDAGVTAGLNFPNVLGRGERVSLDYAYDITKNSQFNLKLLKPFYHTKIGEYKPELSWSFFKHSTASEWSKYVTNNCGGLLDFSFYIPLLQITNSLQYEIAMKEIFPLDKKIPFFIREHCGPRLSSVFRHIASYDDRDSSVYPTKGIYVKTTNELAGNDLKSIAFLKTETHGEINVPLFAGMSMQFASRIGCIVDGKAKEPISINNLFFLGGPHSLRGFMTGGAGPHIEGCATGTRMYWSSGVHIWAPLPFNRYFGEFGNMFRTHLFYNVGNSNSFNFDRLRSTVGIGIALRFGEKVRLEFNYGHPLIIQKGDLYKKGFQFGIGYDFI